ncbi:dephospho-CoA kinase [Mycolicibacillus trivialis]|uniref:Dephospho-CoA kinase n=1 Tax=Mycolicibacillus trivialis TaxID=1798 RepID=A0A1X2EPQ3_9MYCO|nr:dephospho-CoA kinase [Mycolicibacillus trivialis]ORX08113.1 dephospho-CoA kinase [Mycolicibacillus trivialis]
MLRIGLTGGIGAGKSTVSNTFRDCGGIIVDGDVLAREVVEPGTEGLAALVEEFGEQILLPGGALNRPALAKVAFADDAKRARLNQIVHPLVARRRAELIEAADADAVIIEDIPLLVESGMAPLFPLVIVVHTDVETRVARLAEHREMSEQDARARIAAQADDEQRRAVADVWLDNSGTPRELAERARGLWHDRILPFAHHLAAGTTPPEPDTPVAADPTWADQANRIVARLNTACGHHAVRIDHVGPTAVGRAAPDVIDVQVTVRSLDVADELAGALLAAGYPAVAEVDSDPALPGARSTVAALDRAGDTGKDSALWRKRLHASADPGRPARVHLRVDGWPNQQFALLAVDWLTAVPDERDGADLDGDPQTYRRAWSWADGSGWDC